MKREAGDQTALSPGKTPPPANWRGLLAVNLR